MERILLGILFLLSASMYAQVTVSGTVKDAKGDLAKGVSIIVTKVDADNIIGYAISNHQGKYSLKITSEEKKLRINLRSVNYGSKSEVIENKTQEKDFILDDTKVELKGIVVKSSPIHRKGDTINYTVSTFSEKQDRSIADVLKRMPGIEVKNNGQVLYQGQPISKYYIEDLDLMGSRYGIANKSLPHKEVSKVQVLKNHQDIKILDSLEHSENVALNIKLKKDFTITGNSEVGVGRAPLLWFVNATPMLFSKKNQLLVSYQTNNTGEDISEQMDALTIEDLFDGYLSKLSNTQFLTINTSSSPDFSQERWLNNNIHLFTANYLRKLKKDYEIKINTSYVNNSLQENSDLTTYYYTLKDTIQLLEQKKYRTFENNLSAEIIYFRNTKKNYLKNDLTFQADWNTIKGSGATNQKMLSQYLNNKRFSINNKFKRIFSVGKQLVTLQSDIMFSQSPEALSVMPGQLEAIFNENKAFKEVMQKVERKNLQTNHFIKFNKMIKGLGIAFRAGLAQQHQQLLSEIEIAPKKDLSQEFANDLRWDFWSPYTSARTDFTHENLKLTADATLSFDNYRIRDEGIGKGQKVNELIFSPSLSMQYDLTSFWSLKAGAKFNNVSYGSISQLHYAYILKSYRDIYRIDAPLPRTSRNTFSGSLIYENPIWGLLGSASYSYSLGNKNLLYQIHIFENGAKQLQAIERENAYKTHNISYKISRYFTNIKTMLKLSGQYSLQYSEQALNNQIVGIRNDFFNFGAGADIRFSENIGMEYDGNYFLYQNKIAKNAAPTLNRYAHILKLNIYPADNHYLGVKTEYYLNKLPSENRNNFFGDLIYRFTWEKQKIDFELQCRNVFNVKDYITTSISEYVYAIQQLPLRPRQIFLKVKFML